MLLCVRVVLLLAVAVAAHAGSPGGEMPLVFMPNEGQVPSEVRLMAKSPGLGAYFSTGEVLMQVGGSSLRMQFVGASRAVPEGKERLGGHANFLVGPEETWRTDVPLYGEVVYRNLYPGIDLVFGSKNGRLKSEFVVRAGVDSRRIRVRYAGAAGVKLEEDGTLAIAVDGQVVREQAPVLYQYRAGATAAVDGRFLVARDGTIGFQVDDYDRSRTLVIDPLFSYSTLLGGSGFDVATSVAADASGAAYIAGYTDSTNLPTASPFRNFNAGGVDVFVAKLSAAGNALVYCTYLGGSGDDRAYGIAVDSGGAAYVTGSTTSQNFPMLNAIQTKLRGAKNAFVLKLNAAGNTLGFSTYLGGNGTDSGNGIALDAAGGVYVAGDTTSISFPATGLQKGNRGGQDAFVSKLSGDGKQLIYSTYLGGANTDHGAAVAVDTGGSAYVTGSTLSTDFPTAGAAQGTSGGGQDAFVAKVSASGSALVFGTYLGGSGGTVSYPEAGQSIGLDAQGNAYVAGVTSSLDFPLLHPLQSLRHGSSDAFVSKLSASGVLVYSTYLGGYGVDFANAVAVDAAGNAFVAGYTYSNDLAVVDAIQSSSGGDCDAFLARLSATGDVLQYLSYLGGSGADSANALALDGTGKAYVAGFTLSSNFPLMNAYQSINAGGYGAFVSSVGFGGQPVNVGVTPNSGSGLQQSFSAQFSIPSGAGALTSAGLLINASANPANACAVVYDATQATLSLLTDSGGAPGTSISPGSGTLQNSQCTLDGAGSSVSQAGTVFTLRVSLSFKQAFAGSRNIYLASATAVASTGWQAAGTWTIPAPPGVSAVAVVPSAGSGTSQTFQFQYSDSLGVSDLRTVWAYFTPGFSGNSANSCILYYDRVGGQLYLENDAATGWISGTPGGSGSLANSQCSVNLSSTTVMPAGTNLTVSAPLTFTGAFTGAKQVWMYAAGATTTSGWQHMGDWSVSSGLQLGSISPNTALTNAASFALTANGSGFVSGASIQWTAPGGGATTTLTTSFISASQLQTAVPANLLTTAGTAQVAVSSGGTVTASLPFTITAPQPPQLGSISPNTALVNSGAFTLTANGSGFVSGASIQWTAPGGAATTTLTTSFISASQLQAAVPANLLTTAGTAQVAVSSGGAVTASLPFAITAPQPPQLGSISPNAKVVNSGAFTLTANGSAFVSGASIQWTAPGGEAITTLTTSFISTSQLQATVPANLLTTIGQAQVAVSSGGATTAPLVFTITAAPQPQLSSISPNVKVVNSGAFTLTANGSAFVSGASIQWTAPGGGAITTLTTSFISTGQLQATVPANLLTTIGQAQVAVSSGGTTTAPLVFTITAAPPSPQLSSISPVNVRANSPSFTLTADGSNFVSGTSVQWTGPGGGAQTTLETTFISATQVQATVAAALLTVGGVAQVTVKNPDNSLSLARQFVVVPGSGVFPISVLPGNGAGSAQTFQFSYTDSLGAADLRTVWAYFIPAFSGNSANTCILYYDKTSNRLYLENDAATNWSSGVAGTSAVLQNSQCSASLSSTSISQSGNDLTLSLPLTFTGLFTGTKQVWLYAAGSAANSGWQGLGDFMVSTTPPPPQLTSITPNTKVVNSAAFTLTANGSGFVSGASIQWTAAGGGSTALATNFINSSQLQATVPANLLNTAGTAQVSVSSGGGSTASLPFLIAPASPPLQLDSIGPNAAPVNSASFTLTANGSGFVNGASVEWTAAGGGSITLTTSFVSGSKLQATVPASLLTATGAAQVAVRNPDNSLSTAQPFAIVSASGVLPISVTPNTGTGASQTFQFSYSDSLGAADLRTAWVYITPAFNSNSANTCILYYDRTTNRLYLENDAATDWTYASLESNETLQNSQCSASVGSATASLNGNSLTVSVPLTFTSGFTGTKQVWMYAAGSAANSGWKQMGTWTIP